MGARELKCFPTRRNWALVTMAGNAFSTRTGSALSLAFTPQSFPLGLDQRPISGLRHVEHAPDDERRIRVDLQGGPLLGSVQHHDPVVAEGGVAGNPEASRRGLPHTPGDLLGKDIGYPIDTKSLGIRGRWDLKPVDTTIAHEAYGVRTLLSEGVGNQSHKGRAMRPALFTETSGCQPPSENWPLRCKAGACFIRWVVFRVDQHVRPF